MKPTPHDSTGASGLDRRSFFRTALAGAGAMAVPNLLPAAEAWGPVGTERFAEPGRELPLVSDADVIVCGAGPAGVSAAITAARGGARVRLFEWRGCVGGVWTAGLLGYLLDFNKPGFARELATKLDERGIRRGKSKGSITYEPEGMKLLLEDLLVEAGVKFQLHTRAAAAYREGRRLATLVTESKSGRQAWRAPVFIDTTGDGDLGSLAGCEWEIGEAKDCPCQPMSLNALLVCKDAAALAPFIHVSDPDASVALSKKAFLAEIQRTGFFPSYSNPTLWQVRDNLLLVMMNQEFGIKPWDAAEVTAATVRARSELNRIVNALRGLGGPWESLQIAATAEQIGVRDGRRIRGRYVVTEQDIVSGARHEDAVVRPTFGVDIHAVTAELNKTKAIETKGIKVKPYDIPLRALIARDVDGLLMAGRCISGDFIAHASYRVTGNATAMGEAAGAVAAIAAKSGRPPHEVEWSEAVALLTQ
ncbi:MAG: FAD-dependent oxidoreductase, partial [Chthoniobacter sp.]|uniref:FAD-dependent oxidoreductase n=1 Tax=Chthoniobacter sp. TaxID=2510640 RepID=UPI0032A7C954